MSIYICLRITYGLEFLGPLMINLSSKTLQAKLVSREHPHSVLAQLLPELLLDINLVDSLGCSVVVQHLLVTRFEARTRIWCVQK